MSGACHYPVLENPGALNEALGETIRKIVDSRV
jgi:hypothetical protein